MLNKTIFTMINKIEDDGFSKIYFEESSTIKNEDYIIAIQYLLNRFSSISDIKYNEILEDLKLEDDSW